MPSQPPGVSPAFSKIYQLLADMQERIVRSNADVNTELTISLFSAYGAFVPADQLGVSGVLAVVACGLVLGFRAPEIASPESRMQGFGLWSILTFLLNAALFILIGLQLPVIVNGLKWKVHAPYVAREALKAYLVGGPLGDPPVARVKHYRRRKHR